MHTRNFTIVLTALFLFVSTVAAYADDLNVIPQAECNVQRIALFKNGLAYCQSAVQPPADATNFQFQPAGDPIHGTFWLSWPDDLAVRSIVARKVETTGTRDAVSYADLLKANPNARVSIFYDSELFTGTIGDVLNSNTLFSLDRDDVGLTYLELAKIKRINFLDGSPNQTVPTSQQVSRLTAELEQPATDQQTLHADYVTRGITWAPSYQIDISDPYEAVISAKACIINEVADLTNVEIHLVTGYPNIQFTNTLSPLTLTQTLASFLGSLGSSGSHFSRRDSALFSNAMVQHTQAGTSYTAIFPDSAQTGDLFLYPIGSIDLPNNATAYVPIFTESVPYRHVYTWNISDDLVETNRVSSRADRHTERASEQVVWHVIRLENTTDMPWTTAPAATVENGMILGQTTMSYTPSGLERDLRITRAINVQAEEVEYEVSRERSTITLYDRHYDISTVEGTLRVTNHQAEPVYMEITKTLSGEVIESSPAAEIEQPGRGLLELNGLRVLNWTIELQPGQEQEITYQYQLYVPIR